MPVGHPAGERVVAPVGAPARPRGLGRKLRWAAPPKGLLARVRWLFLGFAVFATLGQFPLILSRGGLSVGLRTAAVVLLCWLLWWWMRGYRRGSFPVAGEPVEVVSFMVAGIAVGDPYKAFGLLYAGVIFRALYGSRRRALVFIAAALAAFFAAFLFAPLLGGSGKLSQFAQQVPGVPVIGVLAHLIAAASTRQERASARERILSRVGTSLAMAAGRQAICDQSVQAARALLDGLEGAWAAVSTMQPQGQTIVAIAGDAPPDIVAGRRIDPLAMPAAMQVAIRDGYPVYAEPPPDAQPGAARQFSLSGGRSMLLPLRTQDQLLGALVVTTDGEVPSEVKDALEVLASQVALGLANAALTEDLRHRAFYDALTGLANRALLLDRTEHAIARARREGHRIALLLIDLDKFKQVNDTLGHAAGDRLLVAVADRLRTCARAGDTPARLGGDEFALLLEAIDTLDDATAVAARLLDALRAPVSFEDGELWPQASIGVAVWSGQADVDALLREADAAMYTAKRTGAGMVSCPTAS
jgi:diguanylate cyclase (GGDEF)-like protein